MPDNDLSIKIKQLRKTKGKTQKELADILGVSQGNIADIENERREPSKDLLIALIQKCNVNPAWLFAGSSEMFKEQAELSSPIGIVTDRMDDYIVRPGVKVPILGLMPAGTRTEILDDEKKGEMWLPFTDIKDCVAYYITGNSMENLYYEGDLVIVRPRALEQEIHDGRIYGIDYRIDDQLYRTVKYVYREGREAFRLRSKNGLHKDIVVKDVIRFYRIIREIRGFTDQLA